MSVRNTILGDRLKALRKEKGLSFKKLSDELKQDGIKVSPDALSKYERGVRIPKIDKIRGLANYFGVSIYYLQGIGVTSDEMLDYIIDMLSITKEPVNPVTKEKIDRDDILYVLENFISDDAKKKISVVFPLDNNFYDEDLEYTYVSMQDIKKDGLDSIRMNNHATMYDDDDFFLILVNNIYTREILKKEFQKNIPLLKDYDFLKSFELLPKGSTPEHDVSYLNTGDDAVIFRVYEELYDNYLEKTESVRNMYTKINEEARISKEKNNYGFSTNELLHEIMIRLTDKVLRYDDEELFDIAKVKELETSIESVLTYLDSYKDKVQRHLNRLENSKKN